MLSSYLEILDKWASVFSQKRTLDRMKEFIVAFMCITRRHTITESLIIRAKKDQDWSAEYRLFSRSEWKIRPLFNPVLAMALQYRKTEGMPLAVSIDDTAVFKTGKKIKDTRFMRNPLSPPFHMNIQRGLRYLHAAITLPNADNGGNGKAVSVAFELCPSVKKPGKKATEEELEEYKNLKKTQNLSTKAVDIIANLRNDLDNLNEEDLKLLIVADGSYTNKTVISNLPDNVDFIGRARKDIALFEKAVSKNKNKFYGDRLQTPDEMRQDDNIPYKTVTCFFGGNYRELRYKEVPNVLWKNGAGRRFLRLIIIAPTPYWITKKKRSYRDPAYLITTDLTTPVEFLIQSYIDRWQIEVLHRDLKTGLGISQSQTWSDNSVRRLTSTVVAAYSLLILTALQKFGPGRPDLPLPCWRNKLPQYLTFNEIISALRDDFTNEEAEKKAA